MDRVASRALQVGAWTSLNEVPHSWALLPGLKLVPT